MFKNFAVPKFFKRRGQVLVFYALMIPLLFLFAGVGIDLGWYYLNVSRLQNAADAAAVAGAKEFVDDENVNGFKLVKDYSLISNRSFDENREYSGITDEEKNTIAAANATAENYAIKNLGFKEGDTIISNWSKSKKASDKKVEMTTALYDFGSNFYYVVTLKEAIEHFFMPGWFNNMDAPVMAVVKFAQVDLTDAKNENVIVGNWEVQNKYREQAIQTGKDTIYIYVKDENDKLSEEPVAVFKKGSSAATGAEYTYSYDSTTKKYTVYKNGEELTNPLISYNYKNWQAYIDRFEYELYTGAWNHFQDFRNTINDETRKTIGKTVRIETIDIFDDVKPGPEKNIAGYPIPISYGAESSVAATAAAINNNPKSSAYNPETVAVKTYNPKVSDSDKKAAGPVGLPYTWDRLDSINVDFKPDVSFKKETEYYTDKKDWDLKYGYVNGMSFAYNSFSGTKYTVNNGNLRIHSSINFCAPYKERPTASETPDILWGRIESEPMLFKPDERNGLNSVRGDVLGLSSVRQIIINITKSNTDKDSGGNYIYRPVVMFYDGPERYNTSDPTRASLPVIINLARPFRGVFYFPNSPVVVVGDNKENFQGFIFAKSYLRLKTTKDFEDELAKDSKKYTRTGNDFTTTEEFDNPYYVAETDTVKYSSGYYGAEPEKIKWTYYKIKENGIEMYVDNYGNVQYMDYLDAPKNYGKYDNFGRTDFTTHGYKVLKESAENMLLSGN